MAKKSYDVDVHVGFQRVENGILILAEKNGTITPYAHMDGGTVTFGETLSSIVTKLLNAPSKRAAVTKRKPVTKRKKKAEVAAATAPVPATEPTPAATAPDLFQPPKKRGRKPKFVASAVDAPAQA